ncbi:queuosine precursor transporter [Pseudomonas atacamensis]|uniref:queuosine precursor transporter n=1 Tax=Pseudomonas atacamensis TaxID=2565368 RepID=UPI0021DA87DD|nr:queuosine precursor transporter [Pseudomonas atacamensis]MDH2080750.1 queuosine precursor transporter [Pseudomonas atacamensis]
MSGSIESENNKYKLLGFVADKKLAVIMVVSTGRLIKVKLAELLKSDLIDDLSRAEIRNIYRKYYSTGSALTAYDITDRNERSWMIYVVLNLFLLVLYVFSNIGATKLIYFERFDVVLTPGVFLYPFTFLVVDMLNELYGFKLARKAIFFGFISNALIILLLSVAEKMPGLPGWRLDGAYSEVVLHVSSVLLASSVSFLFSEYANSYLLCRIKQLTNSRYLFLRVFFSTFFAVLIDSVLFCVIAFYGVLENSELLSVVIVQITVKMFFAFFNVLPAYGARSLFKRFVPEARVI